MEDVQQLTTVSRDLPVQDTRDLPVQDTRDLPVSCTTTEGVQNHSNAIYGYRTQSLLHLLSSPAVTFTSDSGATDILMRQRDSHILLHYTT
jgi:hypothetical protein